MLPQGKIALILENVEIEYSHQTVQKMMKFVQRNRIVHLQFEDGLEKMIRCLENL